MRQILTALRQLDAKTGSFESAGLPPHPSGEPQPPDAPEASAHPIETDGGTEVEPAPMARFDGLAKLVQYAADRAEPDEPDSLRPVVLPFVAAREVDEAPAVAPARFQVAIQTWQSQQPLAAPCRALADRLVVEYSAPAALLFSSVDDLESVSLAIAVVGHLVAHRHGRDVVLVDANPHRRALTEGFALDDRPGLAEFHQRPQPDQAPELHATSFPGLSVVPCGRPALRKPDDLASSSFSLVEALRATGRLVLIDGGDPEAAWTRSLASACDGAYLIVRLGQTFASDAAEALEALRRSGAKVAGCIVTGAA